MNANNDDNSLRRWLAAIVIVHFAAALWHGAAHVHVPVALSTMQQAFVLIVITLLPLVGAGLLWTRRRRGGAIIVAISMFGSFVFGFLNHFVLESPDYVMRVPEHEWQHAFVWSAALVAVIEAIGTVLGAIAAWKWSRG